IESISDSNIIVRLVVKTRAGAKDDVARDLRARLKNTLDEMEIALPSLSTVVLSGFDGAESINGSRPPRTRPNPVATTEAGKPLKLPRNRAPRAPRAPKAP
ncbi:MAG TPA: mechanosensitive ion channel family protein, partial [Glaciihabitans sp.]|nr:mechanosensitive ion channel family protein [Glaciihabitans sp.]